MHKSTLTGLQVFDTGDSQAFWRRVNKRIKDLKMTQEYVSEKMSLNYATFRGWSHVKTFPRIDVIFEMAQVLETSMNFLIFGTETEPATTTEYIIGKRIIAILEIVKDYFRKDN